MVLRQGRQRQIRRMCELVGYHRYAVTLGTFPFPPSRKMREGGPPGVHFIIEGRVVVNLGWQHNLGCRIAMWGVQCFS